MLKSSVKDEKTWQVKGAPENLLNVLLQMGHIFHLELGICSIKSEYQDQLSFPRTAT